MAKDLVTLSRSTKYPLDAFAFVQRGLDYTVKRLHGEQKPGGDSTTRHVTGRDLCMGLRDFATEQYGLLARTVLRRWNIQGTEDFGNIVFAMVDAGMMHKTEEDSLDDFIGVYDFAVAFAPSLELHEPTQITTVRPERGGEV